MATNFQNVPQLLIYLERMKYLTREKYDELMRSDRDKVYKKPAM